MGPSGTPWAPFGRPWTCFDLPLGCLGAPLGSVCLPLGSLGVPCGCFPEILETGDLVSYEVTRIAIRSAVLELTTGATGATEVVSGTAAQTLASTHAGGQDDGSYTNSPKLYNILIYNIK